MINSKKQAKEQIDRKSYYREFQDSPVFYRNMGVIGFSNGDNSRVVDISREEPSAQRFFPITNIQVINGSSVDIIFFPNQAPNGFIIPNGSNVVFDRKSLGGGIRSFRITNTSTTTAITDREVEVNYWREGITQDRAFENMHKAFFRFLRGGNLN